MLLVTGATGYVGAALLALLRGRGLPLRVTVRSPERARVLPPDVRWVVADLADPDSVRRAADGCEAVCHLTATVGRSAEQTRRGEVADVVDTTVGWVLASDVADVDRSGGSGTGSSASG